MVAQSLHRTGLELTTYWDLGSQVYNSLFYFPQKNSSSIQLNVALNHDKIKTLVTNTLPKQESNMASSLAETTIISCEHCLFSVECRDVKPCDRYAAALNTNFNMSKEYEVTTELPALNV